MRIRNEASRGQDARLRDKSRGCWHCWQCGKLVRLAATATASARTSRTLTIPLAWAAMALLVSDWGVAASRNDLPSYFHLALLAAPRTHGFLLAVLQPSVLAMRNEERWLPARKDVDA